MLWIDKCLKSCGDHSVIVIDNASTDVTKMSADDWWQTNKHPDIAYNSFIQPIPGKSYAQVQNPKQKFTSHLINY